MSPNIYTVEYAGVPNHGAIYIETNPPATRMTEGGSLYHVTGNVLQGMNQIQTECCQAVPAPRAKLILGGKQSYPGTPLYRCGNVQGLSSDKGLIMR
ncbi:hypothetical protein N7450_009605 [Penicillium hetheringtonii]|uniref:Uncharacterized protein n=1 Tax=Penicillium hetheringtonii TaxID=911720 RepID=A0AAD6DBC5_9EURO|nr:hypothetical protein N7450_009605 [Penicillium hetheringtonii]